MWIQNRLEVCTVCNSYGCCQFCTEHVAPLLLQMKLQWENKWNQLTLQVLCQLQLLSLWVHYLARFGKTTNRMHVSLVEPQFPWRYVWMQWILMILCFSPMSLPKEIHWPNLVASCKNIQETRATWKIGSLKRVNLCGTLVVKRQQVLGFHHLSVLVHAGHGIWANRMGGFKAEMEGKESNRSGCRWWTST